MVLVRTLTPVEELDQQERVDLVITDSGSEVRKSVQALHGGRRYGKEKKEKEHNVLWPKMTLFRCTHKALISSRSGCCDFVAPGWP